MTPAEGDPPTPLVSTRWLADHLDEPDLRLIEVSIDPAYHDGPRIPGAVFWDGFTTILDANLRTRFDHDAVTNLLATSGIDNDSTVVVYSDHPALGPWVFWYLRTIGHTDVRVLDGGRTKWEAEGRPLTNDPVEIPETSYRLGALDTRWRADLDEVRSAVGDTGPVLLDVRSPEEFAGELFILAPPEDGERAGRIPGAIDLYYETAMNPDGTFRSLESLAAMFEEAGVPPDTEIITYCAVGMRAAHMWFVLSALLGRSGVANYDGSWNEWGRRTDVPVEAD